MKSKEIKHPTSGINDTTSYVTSCHISLTSCDSYDCKVPCPHLLDCCLLCWTQEGMNYDMDSLGPAPERLLCHQFWTLTHMACHLSPLHCTYQSPLSFLDLVPDSPLPCGFDNLLACESGFSCSSVMPWHFKKCFFICWPDVMMALRHFPHAKLL